MKTKLTALLAIITVVIRAAGQPNVVSIVQTTPNQTNTIHIADFQYVKVLSARDNSVQTTGRLTISKPPGSMSWNLFPIYGVLPGNQVNPNPESFVCAGPAEVTVISGVGDQRTAGTPVFVTLEIGPGAYSVTNSVTLGPGQGAEINLESSTDLLQWSSATNGVYMADPAMFFRLHLRRLK